MNTNELKPGRVFLVGAGPGDPRLLTLRGRELLELADVVIYDYLADSSLLEFVRKGVELIDVGKRPNRPMPQSEINSIIVNACFRYTTVVRLKGGDPMLFGRGGEELEALEKMGIGYEVVPGVPSAIAVPAYAGIPVTHRGVSTVLTIVTGHRQGGAFDDTDYDALARLGGTIVILMGVEHRGAIASRLLDAGMDPMTPVAAIRWGTRADQTSIRGVLADLGSLGIRSPATIVIGAVARFNFDFFESRPLFGKTIIITRDLTQRSGLEKKLSELGAQVISAPTIEIVPPDDGYLKLDQCIETLSDYDFLVFTSTNAVRVFFSRIHDLRKLGHIKIAAVGSATCDAILQFRVGVDITPDSYDSESLLDVFPSGSGRVLIPRAEVARDILPDGLRDKGYEVTIAPAYKTKRYHPDPGSSQSLADADAICFTSSSTVSNFVETYGLQKLPTKVISIGPATTVTAVSLGIQVTKEAEIHNLDGLSAAVIEIFARHPEGRNTR